MSMSKNGINYIQYGKGIDVVLLHGWGQNIAMMKPLGDKLIDVRITIIDFLGFGESKQLDSGYTIEDYSKSIEELFKELKIKKPILIGHSFGGRVAIHYSSCHDVKKVVLLGSPCVRENRVSKKEQFLKSLKKLPLINNVAEIAKNYIGSTDYKNATPVMRQTLVNVINRDLSEEAKNIKVPVLMIWGDRDTEAPLEDARKLENLLIDGGLVVLPGLTHYAYLEALDNVSNIINNFLECDRK